MSIIYEALKKIEEKGIEFGPPQNYAIRPKPKRKSKFLFFLLIMLFFLALAGISHYYLKKGSDVSLSKKEEVPLKETPLQERLELQPKPIEYHLQGIVYTPDNPFALINGRKLAVGESIDGATLVSISDKGVELEAQGKRVSLVLE